jgi:hypothetical protein
MIGTLTLTFNDVVKIAEEKFSFVSKKEWAARCMYMKKTEEEYLKVGPAIDEISDRIAVNAETDC